MALERCTQVNSNTFSVRVADALQKTMRGLAHAVGAIPYSTRRLIASYRFVKEERVNGERRWHIRVVWR